MFPDKAIGLIGEPVSLKETAKKFPDITCRMFDIISYEDTITNERESRNVLNIILDKVCEQELVEILNHLISQEFNVLQYQLYQSQSTEKGLVLKKITHQLNLLQKSFYEEHVLVTVQKILDCSILTISQSKSSLWHSLRRPRITSSNCYSIVTRKENFEALASRMLRNRFAGNSATNYGNKMEAAARGSFSFKQKVQVHCCGIVISKIFPWLACSPDGLFNENGDWTLLEIKCPDSRKESILVDHENKISFLSYIKLVENEWSLKKRCTYFCQIQVAMFVLNLKKCILYIYSLKINVIRDEEFLSEAIPKLQKFYFEYMLPILCE